MNYDNVIDQKFEVAAAFGVREPGTALVVSSFLRTMIRNRPITPGVSVILQKREDYQSGTRLPHSKGFAEIGQTLSGQLAYGVEGSVYDS